MKCNIIEWSLVISFILIYTLCFCHLQVFSHAEGKPVPQNARGGKVELINNLLLNFREKVYNMFYGEFNHKF